MEYHLRLPVSDEQIQKLQVGDVLFLSGTLFTARDEAHHKLLDRGSQKVPLDLSPMALFHCGPLMKKIQNGWEVVSAGPTTSSRMELFEDRFLDRFNVKIIIGKGGMGKKTLQALQKNTAVYTAFTGGAGALAADAVDKFLNVLWLDELGMPEAVWVFSVKEFGPLIVAMDAHGQSLYNLE